MDQGTWLSVARLRRGMVLLVCAWPDAQGLLNAGAGMDGQKVLISSFRNEAPFVLEFVAHHQAVGFDQIIIASNDCRDGTAEILEALDTMGVIRHVPCMPPPKITPQHFAYAEIRRQLPIDRADWLMILDADEFLNVHAGAGQVSDLIAAQQAGTDLVLINWACFGASGHERWADALTCQRFTWRLRTLAGNGLIKSLIRSPVQWKHLSNHHPYTHSGTTPLRIAFAGGLWVEDIASDAMTFGAFRTVKPQVGSFRIAQINHYATRTADSFDLRRVRGRGAALSGKANDRHTDDYYRRMSGGTFVDDTILRHADAVAARIADYRRNDRLDRAVTAGLRHYEAEIDRYWQGRSAG